MITELPQDTFDSWEKTAAVMREAGTSEDKIKTWFDFCKKWTLEDLNRPKVDESTDSQGIKMDIVRGKDGVSSAVFTHTDGFRCLRIFDDREIPASVDMEKLDFDLPAF